MLGGTIGDIERERESFTLRTGITPGDLRRLVQVPLFSGLNPDDLRKLLATSSIRRYPDLTNLFMEGEPAERFFVVMEGWVKLYRLCEDGHEVVISVMPPVESFAEAAIFGTHAYPVNAMSITDVRLLVVGAETMMREIRENVDFAFNMLGSMSRQLRNNITLLHQRSSMSSTERLAEFMLDMCEFSEGGAKITLPLDKSLIAARLGMQPETFSRALAKLKPMGVTNSGHDVFIKDIANLRSIIKHSAQGCC